MGEAHGVLEKILDKGETIMVSRLEEMERVRLAEQAAEQERQQKAKAEQGMGAILVKLSIPAKDAYGTGL